MTLFKLKEFCVDVDFDRYPEWVIQWPPHLSMRAPAHSGDEVTVVVNVNPVSSYADRMLTGGNVAGGGNRTCRDGKGGHPNARMAAPKCLESPWALRFECPDCNAWYECLAPGTERLDEYPKRKAKP